MEEIPKTRASLLVRIRNPQDDEAWAEFVGLYEPVVYRIARQRGFQDADARELTQDVLVAVASAIERWEPDPARGKFRTWLFRIARNLSINLLASRRRHAQGTGGTDFQTLLEEQEAPRGEDSDLFDQEYRRELFGRAVAQVRGQFREATWQAFWLTSVQGRDIGEVAEELGMSAGAVYIARSRVMARLREKVEELDGKRET
jgi:RNA polymerase sigma-70 factor (ECF subfamily)